MSLSLCLGCDNLNQETLLKKKIHVALLPTNDFRVEWFIEKEKVEKKKKDRRINYKRKTHNSN